MDTSTAQFQVESIEDIVDKEGVSFYSGQKVSNSGEYHAVLRGTVQEDQSPQKKVKIYFDQLWKTAGRTRIEQFNTAMQTLERHHSVIAVLLSQDPVYAIPDYKQLKKLIKSVK